MKTILTLIIINLFSLFKSSDEGYGYKIGDKINDFKLLSTSGARVSLSDFQARGFIIVFTCNSCQYSQAYEERIKKLDSMYTSNGWPVIAINPNDKDISPEDSYNAMIERAKEKKYTFPYLYDATQKVAEDFGAKHTPMVFVIRNLKGNYILKYAGTIDDNTWDEEGIQYNYVGKAIEALNQGKDPEITYTKAIGCAIKWKNKQTGFMENK